MKNIDFYSTLGHSYQEYENSHKDRLDFLIKDLKLNKLNGSIGDFGCGLGFIYYRLNKKLKKQYVGYDFTTLDKKPFNYQRVDLNNFDFTNEKLLYGIYDYAFCFETLEHLTNPYNCLFQIKYLLKKNGILFLSIPNKDCTHNTIYPSLLYPVDNFIVFLNQMAFQAIKHVKHDKCFSQEVFTLINKDWNESKMLFYKSEKKFRNIPPHLSVNL
jgi:2-polyprenyl-3-methyl-5-hydroxy-6-metoxy-1,4-benzoquinol methylase